MIPKLEMHIYGPTGDIAVSAWPSWPEFDFKYEDHGFTVVASIARLKSRRLLNQEAKAPKSLVPIP